MSALVSAEIAEVARLLALPDHFRGWNGIPGALFIAFPLGCLPLTLLRLLAVGARAPPGGGWAMHLMIGGRLTEEKASSAVRGRSRARHWAALILSIHVHPRKLVVAVVPFGLRPIAVMVCTRGSATHVN